MDPPCPPAPPPQKKKEKKSEKFQYINIWLIEIVSQYVTLFLTKQFYNKNKEKFLNNKSNINCGSYF